MADTANGTLTSWETFLPFKKFSKNVLFVIHRMKRKHKSGTFLAAVIVEGGMA